MTLRGRWPLLSALWAALVPTLAAAQACPDGVVSSIVVDNASVFGPEELGGEGRFRWAYDLVNRLHVRTRPWFIQRELLFDRGDCFDPLLLEESERLLRDYRFIARADVYGLRQPDGSWHMVVDTQDEWTTKLNLAAPARTHG